MTMSDFFESGGTEPAATALERRIRHEERRDGRTRKMLTAAVALAVGVAVLLGGGLAGHAIAQQHAEGKAVAAVAAQAASAKHTTNAHHKSSHRTKKHA